MVTAASDGDEANSDERFCCCCRGGLRRRVRRRWRDAARTAVPRDHRRFVSSPRRRLSRPARYSLRNPKSRDRTWGQVAVVTIAPSSGAASQTTVSIENSTFGVMREWSLTSLEAL